MAQNSLTDFQKKIVVIGGSAGSLQVILHILTYLRPDLNIPVVIILHRKNDSDSSLSQLMGLRTSLPVKEADDKEAILPGHIYLAPADYHLLIETDGYFSLDDSEKINFSRPSIDVTFQTAAEAYGAGVTGILLSGANADGVEGLEIIKSLKGIIAVQDPKTAQVPYMPQHAVDSLPVDHLLTIEQIPGFINRL
ncbi:chemotaxis protein CheB [Mucilaginibacter polytrichastri]|uniref:protein-glutamate methylesterase n=1 Tax=Mucilaginibacter polytrichastri TaxID=1302689 RepID=A0A1Q6A042_9SPHI|nr:chemotaxis protein CheB [Mucilaginibacter polytrichastri]OKS87385.1 Putative chemotaxis protein-glutamate methylesterase [Mucilaginibacter polytrichastri]SFT22161.1 CheB methylesterase [Mucilaginibacter polytrichastri]